MRSRTREVTIDALLGAAGDEHGGLAGRSPSPSDHVVRSELAAVLTSAVARLPEHYRLAFAWRHHDQLSWDEIGQRMNCSADAARKVWSRAIHQRRIELSDYRSQS
jgi:RNA polymerase sigma factor (sigma-70 family)